MNDFTPHYDTDIAGNRHALNYSVEAITRHLSLSQHTDQDFFVHHAIGRSIDHVLERPEFVREYLGHTNVETIGRTLTAEAAPRASNR